MSNSRIFFLSMLAVLLCLGSINEARADVYASFVRITQEGTTDPFDGDFSDNTGAAIRFWLNDAADSVVIDIAPAGGGPAIKTLAGYSLSAGDNAIIWDGSQNNGTAAPVDSYKLDLTAYSAGYSMYTEYFIEYPAIFTRGVGSVNNPALRWFGFIYAASGGGYVTGVARHASDGTQYGDTIGNAFLTTTGVPVGPSNLRYATTIDDEGYAYLIRRDVPRGIYRYRIDTIDVKLFDSSAYGTTIQGLDVSGSGASKYLYVTGDNAVFGIPIGTQNFNTAPLETLVEIGPDTGRSLVYWDAEFAEDSSLYVTYRADATLGRGVFKFDLTTGTPKHVADTVWTGHMADGDPVTLAMWEGAPGPSDDILYMSHDVGAPNTELSGIYAWTNLDAASPTRSLAYEDPENNTTSFRGSVVTDVVGNVIYFENSNEHVSLVSPPNGPNSYTYTAFDELTISVAGVTPPLVTIWEAREDLDGDGRPDREGDTVKVIGIINSVNIQTTNFGYFMQDATGGIQIFRFGGGGPTLVPGDRVSVIGEIDFFSGSTEITPADFADITVLDTGNVLTPIPLTIGEYLADAELYEHMLIRVPVVHPLDFDSTAWPAAGSSANLNVWDGLDTTILRIDSDTEIDGSPFPNFPVQLDAVTTQFTSSPPYNTGYQLSPMFIADFVPTDAPPVARFPMLTPPDGGGLALFTGANTYDFTWSPATDFNGDPLIYLWQPVGFTGILSNNSGADPVASIPTATLLGYLGMADSLDLQWTVLAKDPANPPVPNLDTFTVTLKREFFDNFEAYTAGTQLAVQSPDWRTWSGPTGTGEDPFVSDAFAFSGANSVLIVQNNDLVRVHGQLTSGKYRMTFQVYIPNGHAGYFNTMAGFTPNPFVWGMEVYFDVGGGGRLLADQTVTFSYSYDTWQPVEVGVDLDNNMAQFSLNGSLIHSWQWSTGGSPLRLDANDFYGFTANDEMYFDDYRIREDSVIVAVGEDESQIPEVFALYQNYPNPFNPSTTIQYNVPTQSIISLKIYNILGQEIATLVDEVKDAGSFNVQWHGTNQFGSQVASGVYFFRVEAKPIDGSEIFTDLKKMMFLK